MGKARETLQTLEPRLRFSWQFSQCCHSITEARAPSVGRRSAAIQRAPYWRGPSVNRIRVPYGRARARIILRVAVRRKRRSSGVHRDQAARRVTHISDAHDGRDAVDDESALRSIELALQLTKRRAHARK
eukprot:6186363-Pleurochrysis_carterae.AAC.2